jgi:glycosyltransferase involved in cell wall biosynthesis
MLQNKLLMITYHFPPSAASGAFRLLGFARHLLTFGWQPLVIAPPSLPWEPTDPRLTAKIPVEAIVRPVPYPAGAPRLLRKLAQSAIWLPRAWSACKRVIREERPDAILTSGPPHCVHALGHFLARSSGLPWVADFRDPWINDGTPKRLSLVQRWALGWERRVFRSADRVVANAPNACRMLEKAHPAARGKIVTLTNGFDPRSSQGFGVPHPRACFQLLHAGEIYAGRDPAPLLEALATLNAAGPRHRLQVLGRCDADLSALVRERGWADVVQMVGQRPYEETLDALSVADILVLFDSPGRRIGVPAKLFEYLGAGRPILALAEPDGDTAAILRSSGVLHRIAPPKDAAMIGRAIAGLKLEMQSAHKLADPTRLHRFTREAITQSLAQLLDSLIDGQNPSPPGPLPLIAEGEVSELQLQEALR